jgi:preprotein translocase subunit SecD
LTLVSIFIVVPENITVRNFQKNIKYDINFALEKLGIEKDLNFRQGLDLQGGVSITFQADLSDVPSSEKESAVESARDIIERRVNIFGVSEPLIQTQQVNDESRIIVELPGITDINQAINLIGQTANLTFWEQTATISAEIATSSAYPINASFLGLEAIKPTDLSGGDLESSSVNFDQTTGAPVVQLDFNSEGSKKFADITRRNLGQPVPIVLDNIIITAPQVNDEILTGQAVISGTFTQEEANALSTQLNAGALPVPLTVLEQRLVGPTLGQESLQKSLLAGFIGFITIVIFMIAFYKKLGILASIALTIYVILNLAVYKLSSFTPFGITLTLAGIAGFILSIGMAVDANILIFERMREEERLGKGRSSQMELGFSHAWTSIRDSNVSTLITTLILYTFGTGIVKGFALVLAIGVLISMFSAITITRTMLRIVYK